MNDDRLLLTFALAVQAMRNAQLRYSESENLADAKAAEDAEREVDELTALHLLPTPYARSAESTEGAR